MPPIEDDSQRWSLGISSAPSIYRTLLAQGLLITGLVAPLFLPWAGGGLGIALVTMLLIPKIRMLSWLALGSGIAGWWGLSWEAAQIPTHCLRAEVQVVGHVADFVVSDIVSAQGQPRQRLSLDVSDFPAPDCGQPRRLQLTFWQATPQLALGDRITATVRLLPSSSQWNPGVMPDQARNVVAGIDGRGTLLAVDSHTRGDHRGLLNLSDLRLQWAHTIESIPGSQRAAALLTALTVGKDQRIARDDWQRFQRLGLTHVLVISGLHIGLVFFMAWGVLLRIGSFLPMRSISPRWAGLMALGCAFVYALLSGFGLPTQRALWMLSAFLVTRFIGWRTYAPLSLLFAVTILLVTDPFAVLGRSFWLSVGATAALVFWSTMGFGKPRSGWLYKLFGLIGVQVMLMLCMAPLTLFWVGEVSVVGVLCNLLIVPLIALVLIPAALLGGIWTQILPERFNPMWWLALRGLEFLLGLLASIDRTVGSLSTFSAPHISTSSVIGGLLTVLDVGQGTAAVWQEGDRVLLYDTGAGVPGMFSQAEKSLLPWFDEQGLDLVDLLVISHADSDHSGGRELLHDRIKIGAEFGPWGLPCRPGQRLPWPGAAVITMLNGTTEHADDNTDSCVLMISYLGRRLLLAGDIPKARERELVRYWRQQLRAEVLLVAHHGSNTSTAWSFLKWVEPDWAIITAGRANRFGHPAPEVVTRLNASGVNMINTAVSAATTVEITGRGDLSVKSLRSGSFPYWLGLP